jgi:pSer/pThr/pTyr-binding forkhead associated (FHA) protein
MTGVVVLVLRLFATAALYAFLGLALWMMWQELQRAAASAAEQRIPQIRLQIKVRGQEPALRLFSQPEVVLGRDALSDVALSDGAVSARHARLSFHDGQWWIEDLKSTNGTRLNRERLRVPTVMTSGDEITCGTARVLVTLPRKGGGRRSHRGGRDE